jgi:flavin reductase (DIM6/NTAB) family NADH-FMN oxidoreductase RutF
MQIINLGQMRSLVLGEVLTMHIRDGAVIDADRGHVDTPSLRIVGRGGPNSYVKTTEVLKLSVPSVDQWRKDRARKPKNL